MRLGTPRKGVQLEVEALAAAAVETGKPLGSAGMGARIATTLAALAVAGCAGDSSGISEDALSTLVLQRADLPAPFVQFDDGRQGAVETTGAFRLDPGRFGRIDGWKARFRRPGTPSTPGPLVIESRADIFTGDDGASKDLDAYRRELDATVETGGGRRLTSLDIGEEAVGITFRENRVRFFRIAWRHANATALLFVNGFEGVLGRAEVVALARKQQRRLEDAAS